MNFEVCGRGEPLLLISDLAMDRTLWSIQVPALSPILMTVAFDNRGTGKTDSPDSSMSIEVMARDALGLMEVIGLEQAHVMGLGMGGRIAMQMALDRPSRILSLILCSTAPKATPFERHLLQAVLASLRGGMGQRDLARFEVPWLQSERYFVDPRVGEALAGVRMSRLRGTSREAHDRHIQAHLANDLTPRLPTLSVPTLVVGGKRDILVPLAYQEEMASAFPDAELLKLDAAHMVNSEAPMEFNSGVMSFLSRRSAR
ncbi:MAG: alpha/beta hydrolase [Methanomassiliicoccales archaeon]|nr:alpha/beta hydrolase [Methanomassiliicoccales archaeon]